MTEATDEIAVLRREAGALLLEWARLAAPHYGPAGSMDLDLADFPDADGPSYYNQCAHFALLLLSEGVVQGADADERVRFRGLALANLRYILSITDDEYHTPHFSRGRDWGRHVGEWLNYYALASLQLLEHFDVGGGPLRADLATAVEGATAHLARNMQSRFPAAGQVSFPGNHATWHGLLVHRAGAYFKRRDWVEWAQGFFGRWILPTQRPDGVWPEGEGIVVNYSMVTAQAVSLYAEAAGDAAARSSMGRALGFFQRFQFPDGSSAVVVDGRMRYHRRPMLFLPPGFLGGAEGRSLCLERIRAGRHDLETCGIADNGAQGLAFYAAFVQALMAWEHEETEEGLTAEAPGDLPAARLDAGPWTALLGWQLTPEHPSRFLLDSQNYIELWHTDSGYLVGTGNSKHMPRFSTLRRTRGGRPWLPDGARCLRSSATEAVCVYDFGPDAVEVSLRVRAAAVHLDFRPLSGAPDFEAGLMLALAAGDQLRLGARVVVVSPTALIDHTFEAAAPVLAWRGRTFTVPAGARLEYPLVPHNPYTQTGLPEAAAYVGRLSFPLTGDTLQVVAR